MHQPIFCFLISLLPLVSSLVSSLLCFLCLVTRSSLRVRKFHRVEGRLAVRNPLSPPVSRVAKRRKAHARHGICWHWQRNLSRESRMARSHGKMTLQYLLSCWQLQRWLEEWSLLPYLLACAGRSVGECTRAQSGVSCLCSVWT